MIRIVNIILLLSSIAAFACSSIKVFSENEHSGKLADYRTYAFVEVPLDQLDQPTAILYEEVRKRIAAELNDKGYKPDTEKPDLYVTFNMLTEEQRKEVTKSTNPYSPYGMAGMWPSPYAYPGMYNYRYKEIQIKKTGTLVVDLISRELKEPVWRGIGIGPTNDPEERFETAYKIVEKLFRKFPS